MRRRIYMIHGVSSATPSKKPRHQTKEHDYHHEHHGEYHENKEHEYSEHYHEEHHRQDEKHFELPYTQSANALMSAKGYLDYVQKHGYHFTDKLAEHVSRMMQNFNGQQHSWTAAQVKKTFDSLGLTIPTDVTLGDVTYAANMYYADLFPVPIESEAGCIKAAHRIANDPDGYKGKIFCEWTANAIGKAVKIDWEKFL